MPWPISEIGQAHRLLAEGLAQLRHAGDKLLRARHKRLRRAAALLRVAGVGGKLAHRGGDLQQLRSGVLLFCREAVASCDLLGNLLKGERQVELGGAGGGRAVP